MRRELGIATVLGLATIMLLDARDRAHESGRAGREAVAAAAGAGSTVRHAVDRRAPTRPATSRDVEVVVARDTEPLPASPHSPIPVEDLDTPPELERALDDGFAALSKAARARCARDIASPSPGARIRFGIDMTIEAGIARVDKVEIYETTIPNEALEACLVNELDGLHWTVATSDKPLMQVEYSIDLESLRS